MCITCMDHAYRKDTSLSICRPELEHGASQHCSIGDFKSTNGKDGKLLVVVLMAKNWPNNCKSFSIIGDYGNNFDSLIEKNSSFEVS